MKTLTLLIGLFVAQFVMAQNPMFDICPLKIGEKVPEVTVDNQEGEKFKLNEIASEKPTVIIVYRGAWCGYCIKHLSELNEAKTSIEELGYQIIGVSPDQISRLENSSEKANSEIPVYSDADLELIKAFGLNWQVSEEQFKKYVEKYNINLEEWSGKEHHQLPVPAVYVVKDEIVEFQYVNPNYNKRLNAETLLNILQTL